MLLEHGGQSPHIDPTAYVAPTATVCGDVTIGPDSCVLFGAVITADGGPVEIGARCIVMENAVLRGTRRHPLRIANEVLVGPRAYLTGCEVEDEAFLATGSTVFNGARIGRGAEVRINGIVHLKTAVPQGAVVPIGWVAVGDPAEILPPYEHDQIWAIQRPLDFPRTVFGVDRDDPEAMRKLTSRYSRALQHHRDDRVIGD